jgi:hypothetical protein
VHSSATVCIPDDAIVFERATSTFSSGSSTSVVVVVVVVSRAPSRSIPAASTSSSTLLFDFDDEDHIRRHLVFRLKRFLHPNWTPSSQPKPPPGEDLCRLDDPVVVKVVVVKVVVVARIIIIIIVVVVVVFLSLSLCGLFFVKPMMTI